MMNDKVMILFKGCSGVSNHFDVEDTNYTCYIVSARDRRYLSPEVKFSRRSSTESESSHESRISGGWYVNYDGYYNCFKNSPDLFEKTFFWPVKGEIELYVFSLSMSEETKRKAANAGCEMWESTAYYRRERITSSNRLVVTRFRTRSDFRSVFLPNHLADLLHQSVIIAVKPGLALVPHNLEGGYVDVFSTLVNDQNIADVLSGDSDVGRRWAYTIAADLTVYGVGDPLYYVAATEAVSFESYIRNIAECYGFRLFELPLQDPEVSNWIDLGDINC